MSEKRKNGTRAEFQWWLLVIGMVLGVLLIVGVQSVTQNSTQAAANALPYSRFELEMTATALMAQAQATSPAGIDGLLATATHMVQEATATALTSALTASP